ncbi:MAG: UTP--glucose-1-phosphate uridylyltransferase GalU [Bdellovibrionales bacterium]|jgi:UTP--glucose-1-phosphate uridylyltransferase|nr:UTP--glucose-1-phosphate uridylyltransferase GalU [Bdellovibrionales bacterium]
MKIKKVVIPVAGKGTRFLPATKEIPKEMIPILDRPMIHYAVEEAVKANIEEVIFVTSKGKEVIEKYFQRNSTLEEFLSKNGKEKQLQNIKNIGDMISFKTVEQSEQLGLGHAVLCAEELVGDEPFAVILGDDLILSSEPVVGQLMKISEEKNFSPVIGVMEVPNEETFRYGIVSGNMLNDKTLKMDSMVEKPEPQNAPTNLATPGRYILTPDIFQCLKEIPRGSGGEYQLTDAINHLAKKRDVYAHVFEGDRFDTGNLDCYLNAMVEFALRDQRTEGLMRNIIKDKAAQMERGLL